MTQNNLVPKQDDSIYRKFDEQDEIQIINSERYLTSGKWLYEVQGQYSISYDGIRAFATWLARHGIIVQTISSSITESGEEEQLKYTVKVLVKDAISGVTFEGISSQTQYGSRKDGTKYFDSTAETKAHSKAERNAIRKHVPADLINQFIEEVKKNGQIKTLNASENTTKNNSQNSQSSTKKAAHTGPQRWCSCSPPQMRFQKDTKGEWTGYHTCVACNLPVKNAQEIIKMDKTKS